MYSANLKKINRWTVRASLEFYLHVVLRGVVSIFTEHDILIKYTYSECMDGSYIFHMNSLLVVLGALNTQTSECVQNLIKQEFPMNSWIKNLYHDVR